MTTGEKYLLIGDLIDVVDEFVTGDTDLADSIAPVIDSKETPEEKNWHYHFSEEDYDALAEAFSEALDPVVGFICVVDGFVSGDTELSGSIARILNAREAEEDWDYHFSKKDYEYLKEEFSRVLKEHRHKG